MLCRRQQLAAVVVNVAGVAIANWILRTTQQGLQSRQGQAGDIGARRQFARVTAHIRCLGEGVVHIGGDGAVRAHLMGQLIVGIVEEDPGITVGVGGGNDIAEGIQYRLRHTTAGIGLAHLAPQLVVVLQADIAGTARADQGRQLTEAIVSEVGGGDLLVRPQLGLGQRVAVVDGALLVIRQAGTLLHQTTQLVEGAVGDPLLGQALGLDGEPGFAEGGVALLRHHAGAVGGSGHLAAGGIGVTGAAILRVCQGHRIDTAGIGGLRHRLAVMGFGLHLPQIVVGPGRQVAVADVLRDQLVGQAAGGVVTERGGITALVLDGDAVAERIVIVAFGKTVQLAGNAVPDFLGQAVLAPGAIVLGDDHLVVLRTGTERQAGRGQVLPAAGGGHTDAVGITDDGFGVAGIVVLGLGDIAETVDGMGAAPGGVVDEGAVAIIHRGRVQVRGGLCGQFNRLGIGNLAGDFTARRVQGLGHIGVLRPALLEHPQSVGLAAGGVVLVAGLPVQAGIAYQVGHGFRRRVDAVGVLDHRADTAGVIVAGLGDTAEVVDAVGQPAVVVVEIAGTAVDAAVAEQCGDRRRVGTGGDIGGQAGRGQRFTVLHGFTEFPSGVVLLLHHHILRRGRITGRTEGVNRPAQGVVDGISRQAQCIGDNGTVAVLVVLVAAGNRQAGRVDDFTLHPAQFVVTVLGGADKTGGAVHTTAEAALLHLQQVALAVVVILGQQVEAGAVLGRIDNHPRHTTVIVVLGAGHAAAGIHRFLEAVAVAVGGGQIEAAHILGAGQHPALRVVAHLGAHTALIHGSGQLAGGVVFAAGGIVQRVGDRSQVALGVVLVLRLALPAAVHLQVDLEGLTVQVADGLGLHPFRRGHRLRARGIVVLIGGGAV